MSKKIISLVLALIMMLGLFSFPALAADSPSSWAADQVNKAIEAGLVPTSLQSKYTQATTRAEFCALAVALYENVKGAITGRTTFTDTTDVNVENMASIGVVSGVGNNKFDPDAKLTREQAAVMLSRLAEAVDKPFEKKAATFADNGKVSSWALEGVGQVQAAGIMSGVGNNAFAPQDPYTGEQSIITIMRTYDAVKGGTGTTEPTKSGEDNQKLIGTWSSGGGTQQIRKILSGKYDIKAISFGSSIIPGMSYTFNDDGTYMFILLDNYSLLIIEGKYSLSNGKLTLTNNTGKTTSKGNVPIVWEFTTKPADETHSIEFGVSEIWGWDMLYLDGEEIGYSRSEEV